MEGIRRGGVFVEEPLGINTGALRRQLNAELVAIKVALETGSLHDATSTWISSWQERFSQRLRATEDVAPALREFADELREGLRDTVTGSFMEEVSYLGNDGQIYGHKALSSYLKRFLAAKPGKHFCAVRHLAIEESVRFLNKRGFGLPLSSDIEREYEEMTLAGTLPKILTDQGRASLFDEMKEITRVLRFPLDDPLTVRIEYWKDRFVEDLKGDRDLDELFSAYLIEMQALFRDGETESSLEKHNYLRADGKVFGKKAVYYYFGESPEELGLRPHPIADALYQWLKSHEAALPPHPRIVQRYREMMAPTLEPPPVAAPEVVLLPPLFEHSLRTQIRAELSVLSILLRVPYTDTMTARISDWHGRFVYATRGAEDLEEVVRHYAEELTHILCDPVTGSPLEKISYLGSDGAVYGRRALLYYLYNLPEERAGRSPFVLESEALFSVQRHVIVEGAIQWLKRHEAALPPLPHITETYKALKDEGLLPEISDDPEMVEMQEEARRLIAMQREIDAEYEAEVERLAAAGAAAAEEYVDGVFEPVRAAAAARTDAENERIRRAEAETAERLRVLAVEEAEVAKRNEEVKRRNDELDERVQALWGDAHQAERDIVNLREAIAQVKQAIEDKNARDSNDGFGQIAKIVICAAASYFAGWAASEMGAAAAPGVAQPTAGEGAVGGLTWKFATW